MALYQYKGLIGKTRLGSDPRHVDRDTKPYTHSFIHPESAGGSKNGMSTVSADRNLEGRHTC